MNIRFGGLDFLIGNGKVRLKQFAGMFFGEYAIAEVQVAGEDKPSHLGVKMLRSSEGGKLKYLSHEQRENALKIVQRSDLVETESLFYKYNDCNTIRTCTKIKNISSAPIVLEEASAFVAHGIGGDCESLYLTRFFQSHHMECRPIRTSFADAGLRLGSSDGQFRLGGANVGSWSSKEELPQAVIEDGDGNCLFFQIESNASWYYEIGDAGGRIYLSLGGANQAFGGWSKRLLPGESYQTVYAALANGDSVSRAIEEMTKYRRHIAQNSPSDRTLPVIFNEYMHLSWDNPNEEQTRRLVPAIAEAGADYYVIDCGWHNEEEANAIYSYVGQWKESKKRFPHGLRAITDYIRSFGMKAGLWIEPEVVGVRCKEMLDYYDDSCFFCRHGKKVAVQGRYFLDYRNPKVRAYMSETIRRMVEEYGAEYIKFDYNQDCGVGTEIDAYSFGEGLELASQAFFNWVKEMTETYPSVVFEGCASGGMRLDYKTLSVFSLVSTSDQTDYLQYPYIVGNILSAVLPEQAAVWSYPVVFTGDETQSFDREWVKNNITDDQIAINMINGMLGRIHLASRLDLLDEKQFLLVKEGIDYYNQIAKEKHVALPYFPQGFATFGDRTVTIGLKTKNKIYLAVYSLAEQQDVTVSIPEGVREVKIGYPLTSSIKIEQGENAVCVRFANTISAVMLEIETEEKL